MIILGLLATTGCQAPPADPAPPAPKRLYLSPPSTPKRLFDPRRFVGPLQPPTIRLSPVDPERTLHHDQLVHLAGEARDPDDDPSDLQVTWTSSVDGLLFGGPQQPYVTGRVGGDVLLSRGTHRIAAEVVDPAGLRATAHLELVIEGSNIDPACSLDAPADGAASMVGEQILLHGHAEDPDAGAEPLTVTVHSDLDGEVTTSAVNGEGAFGISIDTLSEGEHLLTLTVSDETTGRCITAIRHIVLPRPTPPRIGLELGDPTPEGGQQLRCVIEEPATHPDRSLDHEVSWSATVGGHPRTISGEVLPASRTARGQEWTCRVRATAGPLEIEVIRKHRIGYQLEPRIDSADDLRRMGLRPAEYFDAHRYVPMLDLIEACSQDTIDRFVDEPIWTVAPQTQSHRAVVERVHARLGRRFYYFGREETRDPRAPRRAEESDALWAVSWGRLRGPPETMGRHNRRCADWTAELTVFVTPSLVAELLEPDQRRIEAWADGASSSLAHSFVQALSAE